MPATRPFRIEGLVDDGTPAAGSARPAARPADPARRNASAAAPRPAADGVRPPVSVAPRREPSRVPIYIGAGTLALAVILGGVWFLMLRSQAAPTSDAAAVAPGALATEGSVTVDTRPSGATVVVDGNSRGTTPLQLSLPVGSHTLELGDGAAKRVIPINVTPGVVVSEHIDLLATSASLAAGGESASAAGTGKLEVNSTPPGAQVMVDGAAKGSTPLTLNGVTAGVHNVIVTNGDTSVTQTITVTGGATSAVMASVMPGGANAGWIAIKTPFELQVFEDGKLIGTTSTDRIMLPPGRHVFEVVNTAFGFRAPLTVQVRAGRTETPAITLPNGTLSINVQPWADVWLDGQAIGTTPLANLSVPIGTHEIVWRHPQLGERRKTITLTTQGLRLGLDFSEK